MSEQKARNYSFSKSKRLPLDKMTTVNGIKVPSMPGSCYHAIICALAEHKESVVSWNKINDLVERYMRQYGGAEAWEKFKNKNGVKSYQRRIKDNAHTLTRTGRDCYGYRLHELGMAIYFFKDGAMLLAGGVFESNGSTYDVKFADGRGLQVRYRGTTMTSKEYKRFLESGFISPSAQVLSPCDIKKSRKDSHVPKKKKARAKKLRAQKMDVKVTLDETFNQATAVRLEELGMVVEKAIRNVLIGYIMSDKLIELEEDEDVLGVEIISADKNAEERIKAIARAIEGPIKRQEGHIFRMEDLPTSKKPSKRSAIRP